MRAVDATIRVEVRGAGGGSFVLNIRSGRMSAGDTAAFAPFLTVVQDRAAFETLARESGDSALALLGGLSGLSGEMRLTRKRVESLAQLQGAVHFSVTGDAGFALITHFGAGPVPDDAERVDRGRRRRLPRAAQRQARPRRGLHERQDQGRRRHAARHAARAGGAVRGLAGSRHRAGLRREAAGGGRRRTRAQPSRRPARPSTAQD